jgi:hypothetical protein
VFRCHFFSLFVSPFFFVFAFYAYLFQIICSYFRATAEHSIAFGASWEALHNRYRGTIFDDSSHLENIVRVIYSIGAMHVSLFPHRDYSTLLEDIRSVDDEALSALPDVVREDYDSRDIHDDFAAVDDSDSSIPESSSDSDSSSEQELHEDMSTDRDNEIEDDNWSVIDREEKEDNTIALSSHEQKELLSMYEMKYASRPAERAARLKKRHANVSSASPSSSKCCGRLCPIRINPNTCFTCPSCGAVFCGKACYRYYINDHGCLS